VRLLGLLIAYHAAVAALRRSRSLADGMVLRHARRELARHYGVDVPDPAFVRRLAAGMPSTVARRLSGELTHDEAASIPSPEERAASICERWGDTLRMLAATEGAVYSAPEASA
jgi:hypothetical protein